MSGWARRIGRAAGLALLMAAGAVAATDGPLPLLDDRHLAVVPRTADEAARVAAVLQHPTDFSAPEPFEDKPAGAATVRALATADAFSLPSANIGFAGELDFKVGNGLFRKLWVSAPASTQASDGLGPLYNARACQLCHLKDGRGHAPDGPGDNAVSLFLRVSVPGLPVDNVSAIAGYIATGPDPVYGHQLQDFAVAGQVPEYRLEVSYSEVQVPLSGGEAARLRVPTYAAADLGYGPLAPGAMLSPRVAPQMIGLGLLEAVPAADILALADPEDSDGDGISGRPNIVLAPEFWVPMLGRFGHKAGAATIREQAAAAFSGDMWISNPLFPAGHGECTAAQAACRAAPDGGSADAGGFEIGAEGLDLVAFYSRNLGVPARRDMADPMVLRGKAVFFDTGCAACHTPKFVTHRLADGGAQSFQLIWPFTDLLLHDMGPGLADNRPEARATGSEWRTPPLWGIGLSAQVTGHSQFLHDGRARNLLEAVLWHGGEAGPARDRVVALPPPDRAALIRYLESL